jgi:hypothetical protein
MASFVGARPDSFREAEGGVLPVLKAYRVIQFLFFGAPIRRY